jgi:hypothetical protein
MLSKIDVTNEHVNANKHVQVPSTGNEPIDANEQV